MVSVVTAQIEEKAKRVLPLAPVPVRRADVHKQFRENVFLSSITPGTDEAGQVIYLAEVRVISDHPYFSNTQEITCRGSILLRPDAS